MIFLTIAAIVLFNPQITDNLRLVLCGAWNRRSYNVRQMGEFVCKLGAEKTVQFVGTLKGRILHIESKNAAHDW